MAAAFQQQIFALDARFNAYRAPNNPNFKILYIRRRSQLLRENAKFKDIDTIKKYLNVRSQLLQRRYGVQDNISISSSSSRQRSSSKVNISVEESPTKRKNDMTISENYAFTGVHHIFDQHTEQVSVVKFANNDRSKLCCASDDGTVSICDVTATPPRVSVILDGHTKAVTGGSSIVGGRVTAIACESSGRMFWAANDKGVIVSYRLEGAGGSVSKLRRCSVGAAVSCLSWSPWLARHPALLVSAADDSLCLFRIADREGALVLKKRFEVPHRGRGVRSTFCPIMSFRRGVCVVSGSEDCCVYFLDIEGRSEQPVVNKLQGHAAPVLGVSFSYDESLLATSDVTGLVIIWRRGTV
uniref:WD repeat-containing protein 13 n=1 Tax=Bombyx mori TaxID=7091 RepID=A0A8R2DM18_BOMMO|nr:WD repeat-containing protein 13 isoform X2 [Bombyx mori]